MEEKAENPRKRENLSEKSPQEQNHGFATHSPGKMDHDPFSVTDEETANLPPKGS
jgi:hypothetical protein